MDEEEIYIVCFVWINEEKKHLINFMRINGEKQLCVDK